MLLRRAASHPDWMHHGDKVEGLAKSFPGRLIELEIGGGPRLVAHVNGVDLTLVALGDHEVVSRLKKQRRVRAELETLLDPPQGFVPRSLEAILAMDLAAAVLTALGRPDPRVPLGPEVEPDWLRFLSDEQTEAFLDIAEEVEASLSQKGAAAVHLLEGGRDWEDECPAQSS
jgi:hypothetical protein